MNIRTLGAIIALAVVFVGGAVYFYLHFAGVVP